MKDILEYRDYRQYIADYYADRKAKSAFSWQLQFERRGCNPHSAGYASC